MFRLFRIKTIFPFFLNCHRILDSMKVPGQRSSFHICDILDLNTNSDSKTSIHNANSNTTFQPQTNTSISSRDDANSLSSSATTASPYQLPPNINSAMYPELAPHYHSMFPAVTKSWLKENENYGKFFKSNTIFFEEILLWIRMLGLENTWKDELKSKYLLRLINKK